MKRNLALIRCFQVSASDCRDCERMKNWGGPPLPTVTDLPAAVLVAGS